MKTPLSLAALLLVFALPASAQTDEEAVMAVVNQLFDGMKTADSAMVRSTFDSRARLMRAGVNQQGEPTLSVSPIDEFVGFIGRIQAGQAEEADLGCRRPD